MNRRSISVVLLVATVLLVHSTPPAQAQSAIFNALLKNVVNRVTNYLLEWVMKGLSNLQPYIVRVVDSIAKARTDRGDKEGAKRLNAMREWFNFVGLHKGVPAVAVELWNNREKLGSVWNIVAETYAELDKRAGTDGLEKAWVDMHPKINSAAHKAVTKVIQALPSGPSRKFVAELVHEVTVDQHLGSDLVNALVPDEEARKNFGASIHEFLSTIRSAFEEQVVRETKGSGNRRPEGEAESLRKESGFKDPADDEF